MAKWALITEIIKVISRIVHQVINNPFNFQEINHIFQTKPYYKALQNLPPLFTHGPGILTCLAKSTVFLENMNQMAGLHDP